MDASERVSAFNKIQNSKVIGFIKKTQDKTEIHREESYVQFGRKFKSVSELKLLFVMDAQQI